MSSTDMKVPSVQPAKRRSIQSRVRYQAPIRLAGTRMGPRCRAGARKRAAVERIHRRVAPARDLLGGLGAEIGHHRDAVAVAAQQ